MMFKDEGMLNQVFVRCYLRSVLDLNFYPDLSTSTWVSTTYEECHNWFSAHHFSGLT